MSPEHSVAGRGCVHASAQPCRVTRGATTRRRTADAGRSVVHRVRVEHVDARPAVVEGIGPVWRRRLQHGEAARQRRLAPSARGASHGIADLDRRARARAPLRAARSRPLASAGGVGCTPKSNASRRAHSSAHGGDRAGRRGDRPRTVERTSRAVRVVAGERHRPGDRRPRRRASTDRRGRDVRRVVGTGRPAASHSRRMATRSSSRNDSRLAPTHSSGDDLARGGRAPPIAHPIGGPIVGAELHEVAARRSLERCRPPRPSRPAGARSPRPSGRRSRRPRRRR